MVSIPKINSVVSSSNLLQQSYTTDRFVVLQPLQPPRPHHSEKEVAEMKKERAKERKISRTVNYIATAATVASFVVSILALRKGRGV